MMCPWMASEEVAELRKRMITFEGPEEIHLPMAAPTSRGKKYRENRKEVKTHVVWLLVVD